MRKLRLLLTRLLRRRDPAWVAIVRAKADL
jgi:hypothetical protein